VNHSSTEIIPVVLENGTKLRVEVRSLGGREPVGVIAEQRFKDVIDSIEAIAAAFGESLKKINPKKASVEFGIEIGLESGHLTALICKGTATANLKITLEWTDESGTSGRKSPDGGRV
jgi:hypothetical protein